MASLLLIDIGARRRPLRPLNVQRVLPFIEPAGVRPTMSDRQLFVLTFVAGFMAISGFIA